MLTATQVLFSFPIYSSCVDRLAQISAQLGPDGLSVMVDHREQLKHLTALASKSGNPPLVFLKVNVGADRAGVSPDSPDCLHLVDQLLVSEAVGSCRFLGVYAHTSQSYETREDWEALDYLGTEIGGLHRVAQAVRRERPTHPLVLSVGASPQVTSLQHPAFTEPRVPGVSRAPGSPRSDALISKLSAMMSTLQQEDLTLVRSFPDHLLPFPETISYPLPLVFPVSATPSDRGSEDALRRPGLGTY